MQNYRITIRGKQHYVAPKVGKAWTLDERAAIRKALEAVGYFVTFISQARLSVSETSNSPEIDAAEIYIEGV